MKTVLKVADEDTFALHSEFKRDLKKKNYQVGFNGLDCGVGQRSDIYIMMQCLFVCHEK